MDIANLTKASSVAPVVAKVIEGSSGSQPSVTKGNSLPHEGQASVRAEASLTTNSVSPFNPEELNTLVHQANVVLQERSSDLKFTVVEGTDISVVRIEDTETGELIRQVPSEAVVAIAKALSEAQQGMMLEEKA